jgi:uncharacterized membrane protein
MTTRFKLSKIAPMLPILGVVCYRLAVVTQSMALLMLIPSVCLVMVISAMIYKRTWISYIGGTVTICLAIYLIGHLSSHKPW